MTPNSRSYLGRFAQADTIVPNTRNINLVVSYSEENLLQQLNIHNAQTLSVTVGEKKNLDVPDNSLVLDRYSYVSNNPIRFRDPTGHCGDPASGTLCLALIPTGPVGWIVIGGLIIVDVILVVKAYQHVASLDDATSVEALGEYVPPGLVGAERDRYREALHRYKDAWGLGAADNVQKEILDEIAKKIKKGYDPEDAADDVDSPPESD